jgi:hypothetical protein
VKNLFLQTKYRLALALCEAGWTFARDENAWGATYLRRGEDREFLVDVKATPPHAMARAAREEILREDPYRFETFALHLRGPLWVEPIHGMVVREKGLILRNLFCRSLVFFIRSCEEIPGFSLSFYRWVLAGHDVRDGIAPPYYWQFRKQQRKALKLKRAILFRHHHGENSYFHLYHDLLPILFETLAVPELSDWPILTSRSVWDKNYFQGVLKHSGLSSRQWIIQEPGTCIELEELVVAKGVGLTRSWLDNLKKMFRLGDKPGYRNRKLFLTRGSGTVRTLENRSEVTAFLGEKGFACVDAGAMSYEEQVACFSDCRYLVAEHGAGVMNILYRLGAPLSLLELVPATYLAAWYYHLAEGLDMNYDLIQGPVSGNSYSYRIPLEELSRSIERWEREESWVAAV